MIAPNTPTTLKGFYEQTFKPERVADKLATTVDSWDRSVRVFLQFAGDDMALATINEKRLTEFGNWTREQGIGDMTGTDHVRRVRSIVRESKPIKPTEDDVRREAARHVAESSNAADGTLMQYLETEYVPYRELAVRTIEHYTASIAAFEKWRGQTVLLSDLSDDLLNRFLQSQQEKGLSSSTVSGRRTDILVMWRAAELDGEVDTMPRRVRRIKIPRLKITSWTLEELGKLVRAAEGINSYATIEGNDGPLTFHRGKLLKAYLLVGWDTGLRRGDMLRLKRSDIQDDGRIELVQGKTDSRHVCMVRPETIAAIDETFLHPRERIFQIKGAWLNQWFGVLVSRANVLEDRKKTHKLRRSSGSHVEAIHPGAGPKHLGHAPQGLFGRHYEDLSVSRAEPTLPPPIPGYQAETNGNGKPAAAPPPLPTSGKAVPSC